MTATPHNGKEADFQLFLALLDGDRFEGKFRDGVHQVDVSDLMRRMVKENLLKFDGCPLFPERIANTVPYKLTDDEARLYREVTDYVREEFNLNSLEARRRADELQNRLENRIAELNREAQLSALPPVALGGFLIVPMGLIAAMTDRPVTGMMTATHTQESSARARAIVMDIERRLGYEPIDRELEHVGYDIESRDPRSGHLRFIEVKGRISSAETITVTKNEILYSLNKPDNYILAIVAFLDGGKHQVHYIRRPFQREPDFGVTSVNYNFSELVMNGESPR